MRRPIARPAWLVWAIWLAACTVAPPLPTTDSAQRVHTLYVVSNRWHTAITVDRLKIVATGLLPETVDFPDAKFLEIGWGDRAYYPAQRTTLEMTLRAAFVPTSAVMHVAGRTRAPKASPPGAASEVVQLMLSDVQFHRLIRTIAAEFDRPEGGRAEPIAPGLYPGSHFYDAHGTFHLLNTCNTWTARMLSSGGIKVSPSGVVTADAVMARLRTAIQADAVSGGSNMRSGPIGELTPAWRN